MFSSVALAVDLGGTKVEAALVDANGQLVPGSQFRQPTGTERSTTALEDNVTAVILGALATLPGGAELLGVGVGAAGPIRQQDGLVSPLNLPAWRDYPLKSLVEDLVPKVPVTLRIDGLCIVLAEHWVGAAHGVDNVMAMVVSTGVGGGLILGGVSVPGPSGNAGHIGHIAVAGFEDECACGGRGCLEAIASGPSTVAWARSHGWTGSSGEDLAASYQAGEEISRAAVKRSGRAIGSAIASATALVELDLVAIGGGFSQVTPDLFGHIRASIAESSDFAFVTKVRVVPSGLSGNGPLVGAAALIHRAELLA